MDRFVSTFTNKIDAKGRVSVPASFRAVLERDGYTQGSTGGIYCYPSLDAPALDAGGQSLARKIDGLLDGLPDYSDERDELSVALYGDVHILRSIRTDVSCFLRRFAPTPAFRPASHSWASAANSRCGSRRASRSAAPAPARRSRSIAGFSARGPASIRGIEAAREEHGNNGDARQPPGRGCPERDRRPCSRAAFPSAADARSGSGRNPTLTPPSAPAATARRSSRPQPRARVLGIDRDPARLRPGRRSSEQHAWATDAGRRTLRRPRPHRARGTVRAGRWRGARYRRLLDAARRSRSAAFPSRPTGRSTCACRPTGRKPDRRRRRRQYRGGDAAGRHSLPSGRGAKLTRHRARHRCPSPATAVRAHARAGQPGARSSGAREDRRPACGDAHLPGAAHLRQRRAGRACPAHSPLPSACSSRAGASWWSPSTRSRTGWSSSSSSNARSRSRTARATCRRQRRAATPEFPVR